MSALLDLRLRPRNHRQFVPWNAAVSRWYKMNKASGWANESIARGGRAAAPDQWRYRRASIGSTFGSDKPSTVFIGRQSMRSDCGEVFAPHGVRCGRPRCSLPSQRNSSWRLRPLQHPQLIAQREDLADARRHEPAPHLGASPGTSALTSSRTEPTADCPQVQWNQLA
jgi:hypothetical protein